MTGEDAAGGPVAGGGRDDEAAWRDLIAHFDTPVAGGDPVPWPEREDLGGQDPAGQDAAGQDLAGQDLAGQGLAGQDPAGQDPAGQDLAGQDSVGQDPAGQDPAGQDAAGQDPGGQARVARADTLPDSLAGPLPPADTVTFSPARQATPAEEDHFFPPSPPPLPSIDPITKGAWAALFGGPAYLLIATAAGWTVPGIAAFCAVAAFIGGFAILVLRMDDGPPGGDSGPDDGAVV